MREHKGNSWKLSWVDPFNPKPLNRLRGLLQELQIPVKDWALEYHTLILFFLKGTLMK